MSLYESTGNKYIYMTKKRKALLKFFIYYPTMFNEMDIA